MKTRQAAIKNVKGYNRHARGAWPAVTEGYPFEPRPTAYCGVLPADTARPQAGKDYPTDLSEFDRFFPDEAVCEAYLERLRWPNGFVCPWCADGRTPWRTARGPRLCAGCRRRVSLTAGTIFEGTREPFKLWFTAGWEITGDSCRANAATIKRILGVKSYKTAWSWLHKFRRAMVPPGRDELLGLVEVDETYVGGDEEGGKGRFRKRKAIVAIAVEVTEHGYGHVRLRHIPNVKAETLEKFVTDVVEPGTTVHTDAWAGYRNLETLGYDHRVTNPSKSPDPAHVVMPGVCRIASLLNRWLLGTFQGAVSNEHLSYYLDEYTFRFNRRDSMSRGLLFYRLLEQAVQTDHVPTHALFMGTGRGQRRPREPPTFL